MNNTLLDMIIAGIELKIDKNETVLRLYDQKSGIEIERIRKSLDFGAELMQKVQVEVSEEEKRYLETGVETK